VSSDEFVSISISILSGEFASGDEILIDCGDNGKFSFKKQ